MGSFPTSIVSPTDPTSANHLNSPSHSAQHQSHNAEIVAVETKVGTGSSTPSSGKVLRATGTGTSSWSQVDATTDIGTFASSALRALLTDETGTGVAVFATSPTLTTPSITNPTVTTGTFASPVLTTPKIVTSINDSNGNEVIKTPATASATNDVTVTNAPNGTAPTISASGSSDANVNLNLRGKGVARPTIGLGALPIYIYDYVSSGCIITADSVGVNKNYSTSSGVVVIGGNPLTVASNSAQTVGASKDRYIDLSDNGDGTALVTTTEVTNNAASPALAAGSLRLGIVVAGATTIASTGSINQGQEFVGLPIASSIPYMFTDSLGNIICNRDPQQKYIGYRQLTADITTTSTTFVDITGLNLTCMIPSSRKVEIIICLPAMFTGAAARVEFNILDVTAGTTVSDVVINPGNTIAQPLFVSKLITVPASGARNYKVQWKVSTNAAHTNGGNTTSDGAYYLAVKLA